MNNYFRLEIVTHKLQPEIRLGRRRILFSILVLWSVEIYILMKGIMIHNQSRTKNYFLNDDTISLPKLVTKQTTVIPATPRPRARPRRR